MNYNIEQVLTEAKELLKEEMSQISHKTWIEPLKIASIIDNNVTLVSEDSFKRDMADTKFHDLIMNTFSVILQKNCTLYLSERFVTGLTYSDGTPLMAGNYTFDFVFSHTVPYDYRPTWPATAAAASAMSGLSTDSMSPASQS